MHKNGPNGKIEALQETRHGGPNTGIARYRMERLERP